MTEDVSGVSFSGASAANVEIERLSRAAGRGGVWAAGGSVLGALAASSCCILPLVLFTMGASGAWIGTFGRLMPYQPIFIAITAVFLVAGYRIAYRRRKAAACGEDGACSTPRSWLLVRSALWLASVLVVAAAAFPYLAPALLGT